MAEHERLVLSDHDLDLFLAALDHPPEPGAALQRAAEKFQAKCGDGNL